MKVILDEDQIQAAVKQIALKLSDLQFDVVLCTLSGAVPFFSDLIKRMEGDFEVDYIKAISYVSAYDDPTHITRRYQCQVTGPFGQTLLEGKNVLVIEDIIDTGKTVKALRDHLQQFNCKNISFISLLKRKGVKITGDCHGFIEVDEGWLIGYGMNDSQNKKRNLPYIYVNI